MTWLTEAAALLSGGPAHPPCAANHDTHATVSIHCDLAAHGVPDWPTADLAFDMDVFWPESIPGYCPADSDVSRTLTRYGAWEAWESVLALHLLAGPGGGVFIDFGANVGWYSLLAQSQGVPVLAVEADPSIAAVCETNLHMAMYEGDPSAEVARGWIGPDTPTLPPGPRVRLCKIDTEGAEAECIRVLGPLLDAHLVDYLLVELTPAFGDGAHRAVKALEAAGYCGYEIADKGCDVAAFEADPLGETLRRPLVLGEAQVNTLWSVRL